MNASNQLRTDLPTDWDRSPTRWRELRDMDSAAANDDDRRSEDEKSSHTQDEQVHTERGAIEAVRRKLRTTAALERRLAVERELVRLPLRMISDPVYTETSIGLIGAVTAALVVAMLYFALQ